MIFERGQPADAAYLCLKGRAEMRWPDARPEDPPISFVEPGRLIGDLSIIIGEERKANLVAVTAASFLRIGAEEFRAVIENDPDVAVALLQTVARNLSVAAESLRLSHVDLSGLADAPAKQASPQSVTGDDDE